MANTYETVTADLGEMRFGDTVIDTGSFKVSYKIKNERQTTTGSYDGVGWKNSEREYEWEASDILPEFEDLLRQRWRDQTSDVHGLTISTYNFLENGDYEEKDVLYSCMIESIDFEQEGGRSITVKGGALRVKAPA